MSVNCPDVWPGYIYAPSRSPKFLCLLPIFQDFAGWWLDPSGTWRNGSCRNQNRKMPARNQKSVFFPDIWPGYIYAPGSSPKFSLPATHFSHAFWLGTRLLHFSASQGLARKTRKKISQAQGDIKNWKSVFCLDIWPEYIYARDFPAFQAPSAGARISAQSTSAAFLSRYLGISSAVCAFPAILRATDSFQGEV